MPFCAHPAAASQPSPGGGWGLRLLIRLVFSFFFDLRQPHVLVFISRLGYWNVVEPIISQLGICKLRVQKIHTRNTMKNRANQVYARVGGPIGRHWPAGNRQEQTCNAMNMKRKKLMSDVMLAQALTNMCTNRQVY